MTTRRRRRGFSSRMKPAVGWTRATLLSTSTVAAGSTVGIDLLGAFTVAEKRNVGKILRVFGTFKFRSNADDFPIGGAFGINVIRDDAFAAAAWTDPLTDSEASWYWYSSLLQDSKLNLMEAVHVATKTQRRLNGSWETLGLIVENSGSSQSTLEFQLGFSVLYQKT